MKNCLKYLVLGMIGFLSLNTAWARKSSTRFSGKTVRLSALSVMAPNDATLATETSYSAPLSKPDNWEVPTFASDMNDALMGEGMRQYMDARYGYQLQEYSIRNGYFAMNRDSRLSRPDFLNDAPSAGMHNQMMQSLKGYITMRGLPQFLKSREGTRRYGQMYEDTMVKAQKTARVELSRPNSKWKFSAGVQPRGQNGWLPRLRAYSYFGNKIWEIEYSEYLDKSSTRNVRMARNFQNYQISAGYNLYANNVSSGISYNWSPYLSGAFETGMKVQGYGFWNDVTNRVRMRYIF